MRGQQEGNRPAQLDAAERLPRGGILRHQQTRAGGVRAAVGAAHSGRLMRRTVSLHNAWHDVTQHPQRPATAGAAAPTCAISSGTRGMLPPIWAYGQAVTSPGWLVGVMVMPACSGGGRQRCEAGSAASHALRRPSAHLVCWPVN